MKALGLAALLGWAASAWAVIDPYEFAHEADRVRYQHLIDVLRCPKCQNQNLADSNAPIAQDLRREIYQHLQAGESNDQIEAYLVARYGDFVRYDPPLNIKTVLLWTGPWLLLCLGLFALVKTVRRRWASAVSAPPAALNVEEQSNLKALLDRNAHD